MTVDRPERRSLAQQSEDDWNALRSVGELFPGTPLGDSADELPAWPENLRGAPVVLAAGAGDVALRVAAVTARELALVVTDDVDAARAVLDAHGRNNVQVSVTGDAVAEIATEPVRWIGGSPDARALTALLGSQVASRLRVTQLQVADGAGPLLEAARAGRLKLDVVSPNPGDGDLGPAVAVAAALLLPFVDLRQVPVAVDASGRFTPQAGGTVLWWGVSPEAGAIQAWLDRVHGGN